MTEKFGWSGYRTIGVPVPLLDQMTHKRLKELDDEEFVEAFASHSQADGLFHREQVARLLAMTDHRVQDKQPDWFAWSLAESGHFIELARKRFVEPESKPSEGWNEHPMAD